MKTKEQWIEETLESLDGIGTIPTPPELTSSILEQMQLQRPDQLSSASRLVWKIAAGLLILIMLNILFVFHYTRQDASEITSNPLSTEYFTYIETINY